MGLVAIHVGIGAWLGLEDYAPTIVMCGCATIKFWCYVVLLRIFGT